MSLKFERKLPLVLTFVFFVLTTLGIFSYQTTVSIKEEIDWQNRTRKTLDRLDTILTNTVDTDAAVMSFVIVGNESYLAPSTRAERETDQALAELQELISDDQQQTAEYKTLADLVNKKKEATKELTDLRRNTDFDTTIAKVATMNFQGPALEIRASVDRIRKRELDLLQQHESAMDRNMSRTMTILIVSSLAGVVALVLANLIVVLENNRRRTAEAALIRSKEELEEKVIARTKELKAANETLIESAAEKEKLFANEQSARREAEIANRLRDEFMATVSHELRTPLNSILGWARLLKSGNLDPRQSSKAVNTIIKNSESQNRLIQDLLDVARMISGKLELEVSDVRVAEFVEHAVETARPVAVKRNITLDLDMDSDTGTRLISGDRVRLEQIIGNLLTNAIKFSRPDSIVKVCAHSRDGFVEVTVADHGAGISPEFLPLVFERFRQDRSTIKQSGGLGLGLAVVRNLTELHGGTVSVQSEGKNKGSTFTVRLPAANGQGS